MASRTHHPLAAWAHARGLTQQQLAAELGCSPGTVSHLLCGRRLPSRRLADRILDLTDGTVRVEAVWSGADGEWRTALTRCPTAASCCRGSPTATCAACRY